MKILVMQGSARKNGNTAALVDAFVEGAREGGHEVTVFNVANREIAGCLGCEYCHTTGNGACIQQDDMQEIYAQWNISDMLVLASPIYYGSLTGQLQCALHRTYALGIPQQLKKTALILSSGAAEVHAGAEYIYKGFVQGYFKAEDAGIYKAVGTENGSSEKLEELRAFGRSL